MSVRMSSDCMSILSVYLSARVSQKRHVQTSRNFLYMLNVVTAGSFCDKNALGTCGWRHICP